MWFWRGAQSAAFYYVTCTPCADAAYRRKRKREAIRSQREKAKLATAVVTDQPRPFQQPTPFSTNEAWREEIALGPGPPARRGGHRPNNQRGDAWQQKEVKPSDGSQSDPAQKRDRNSLVHASLSDRWKSLRYQREDEPLWGEDSENERAGTSFGVRGRTRAETNASSKYYSVTVPPVNDLHPPIVSAPRSRAETRWMLQPPPSAKVMAGKEPSSYRARTSRGINRDDTLPRVSDDRANHDRPTGPAVASHMTLHALDADDQTTTQQHPFDTTTLVKNRIHESGDTHSRPRRPSLTLASLPHTYHGYGDRDRLPTSPGSLDSTVSTLADTSGRRSPTLLWQYPDTPTSRPTSKATVDDSRKAFRPTITKSLTTVHRDPSSKKIHMLRLEINNDAKDDIEVGHVEKIRPWRWSMDI